MRDHQEPHDGRVPIVDAHQHFWDLSLRRHPWLCREPWLPFRYGDYGAIRRDYLPDAYFRDCARQPVVKTVHMEAEWDPDDPLGETRWLMDLHRRTGFPNAIVGQAWFAREDAAAVLEAQADCPLIRAIRQKPAATPTPAEFRPGRKGSLADPTFRAGYAHLARHGLHFELQTPWWHLGEAADLADDHPDTLIVLNHTGLPVDRSTEGLAAWHSALATLAQRPNCAVKISGIGQPGRAWTADRQREVVLPTIEIFGVERCLFASNFPVDSLCATFDEIFDGFRQIVSDFGADEQRALFHDNAMRIYRPV